MKLIVFGASGGTGKQFVEQALEAGHEVTAFVRSPEKLGVKHARLQIIQGDALQRDAVVEAMIGQEAAVSCLGAAGLKKSTALTEMTANISAGMKQHNIQRIVYVASAGIHHEMPGIIGFLAGLILKNVLEDHRHAVDQLITNDFDWTVARPLSLDNGARTTIYRETKQGIPRGGRKISRADVAHFLLKSLEQPSSYVKQSVGLAY